jgi:hypothetical protein
MATPQQTDMVAELNAVCIKWAENLDGLNVLMAMASVMAGQMYANSRLPLDERRKVYGDFAKRVMDLADEFAAHEIESLAKRN